MSRTTSPAPIGDSGAIYQIRASQFVSDWTDCSFESYHDQWERNTSFARIVVLAPDSRALASANSASDALPARNAGMTKFVIIGDEAVDLWNSANQGSRC